jgi:hypothetical protein
VSHRCLAELQLLSSIHSCLLFQKSISGQVTTQGREWADFNLVSKAEKKDTFCNQSADEETWPAGLTPRVFMGFC